VAFFLAFDSWSKFLTKVDSWSKFLTKVDSWSMFLTKFNDWSKFSTKVDYCNFDDRPRSRLLTLTDFFEDFEAILYEFFHFPTEKPTA